MRKPAAAWSRHPRLIEVLEARAYLSAAINFADHVDFTAGTAPVALASADLNSDGNKDLVVVDNTTEKASVFFGSGTGAFTAGPVLSLNAPPVAVVIGDFNGDGKPDIAVAASPGNSNAGTTVTVFLNAGSGTFDAGQSTTVETGVGSNEPVALATGDFNGDGHLDVAVTDNSKGAVSLLLGTGTGTFLSPQSVAVGALPTAIAVADFNSDGKPDIAVTDSATDSSTSIQYDAVTLLEGTGNGAFTAIGNVPVGATGSSSLAVADMNGDGKPDLIVGNTDTTDTILLNSGGQFTPSAVATTNGGSTAVAAGDFNEDGIVDLASVDGGTAFSSSANTVTVITGAGAGAIGTTASLPTGQLPKGIVVADFNNDGKPDIAVANEGSGTVSVILNTTVVPALATTTALTTSNASVPFGTNVTLTATVTLNNGNSLPMPAGTLNFF